MENDTTNQNTRHEDVLDENTTSPSAVPDKSQDDDTDEVPNKVQDVQTPEEQYDEAIDAHLTLGEASEHIQGSLRGQDGEKLNIPETLPVLPLKDVVVYPFGMQPLGAGQARSLRLIDDVMRGDSLVALVAQKSDEIEQAGPDDIFKNGTVARIARMLRMPDGTVQIVVQGLERVDIGEFTQEKPYLVAHVTVRPDTQEEDDETEAIKRNVISYFQRLVALVQNVPKSVAAATLNLEEARQVVYVIATFVQMDLDLRQKLLEFDSVRAKLQHLSSFYSTSWRFSS